VPSTLRVLSGSIAAAALVAVSLALGGGCDWFDDAIEPNLSPDTTMLTCPGTVEAGTSVTIEWSGSDADGTVVSYAWTLDDTTSGSTSTTSATFDSVQAGAHVFTVAAVDDDGDTDPSPAECSFVAIDEGENLPPETELTTCPGTVTAGDDVTLRWSGSDADGSVVSYLWTLDGSDETATADTMLVVQNVSAGGHTFGVAAVDDDGDADGTPAVCTFTADEAGEPVPRVVLVELFTTLSCINCPNAEEGLHLMLDEYGADSLCVVAYHDLGPPLGPDLLATAEMMDRIDWYTDVHGFADLHPLALFDGDFERPVPGALSPEAAADDYRTEIEASLGIPSPLTLRLSGTISAGRATVTARVRVQDDPGVGDLVLRTVVVEDDVSSQGRVFDFVARDILDDEPLTVAAVGDSAVVSRTFDIGPGWSVGELDVIAFVQNDATQAVLQAARLNVTR
jgi:hypothetical protein